MARILTIPQYFHKIHGIGIVVALTRVTKNHYVMTEFNTKNIEKTLNKLGRDLQTFDESLAPEKDTYVTIINAHPLPTGPSNLKRAALSGSVAP